MKRNRLFMGLTAAVLLLASCRDVIEEVSPGEAAGNDGAEEYVYMSAEVRLPAGDYLSTRSSTYNPDDGEEGGGDDENNHPSNANPNTEAGKEYENTVQTCLLVIADKNDEFRAVSAVNGIKMNTVDGQPGFSATAKFDRRMIKALYESGENGSLKEEYEGGFHVFAFCNPSDLLTQKMSAIANARLGGAGSVDWTGDGAATYDLADLTGIIKENPMKPGATPTTSNNIWAPGRFMMANASIKTVSLPVNENDWDHHADSETPFNLTGANDSHAGTTGPVDNSGGGAIKVERLAARFDYRDASDDKTADGRTLYGVGNNIYKVLGSMDSDAGTGGDSYNFVNVKLSRIGLVNMAREMYYLKRVSEDGKEYKEDRGTHKWSLLGKEKSNPFNYVVSPNADDKTEGKTVAETRVKGKEWYNFPLFAEDGSYDKSAWSMYNLGDVVKKGTEMDQWTKNPGDYHIWRYCTENTIPGPANARENPLQDNLFSTGIVFKGKLIAGQFLGKPRKTTTTVNGEDEEKWVPYMTYNVQRAILASTLGLPLGNAEEMAAFDWKTVKDSVAKENPNLEKLVLYNPKTDNSEEGGKSWSQIGAEDFEDMTSYPALYLFEGNLYAGFNEAAEYAYYDGSGGTLYQAMSEVMKHYYLNTKAPDWIELAGVDGKGDGKGGHAGEVQGFVQHDTDPGDGYVPLTVEIFAQILGIIDRSSVDEKAGETYYDRKEYGVRWVDTSEEKVRGETTKFKEWLTSGKGSSFHFTLYDVSNETDNYGGESSTSQGWGYYCYYFYWNRHNDNGIPGVMAPMEFAVVRNNVYKLAVTKINQLGHPTDTSNDPTPPTPHTDDETSEVYMKVEVEVLPWTVRVNEIQF